MKKNIYTKLLGIKSITINRKKINLSIELLNQINSNQSKDSDKNGL